MAKHIHQRMKEMRERRKAANWKELRLWVPTEADAAELQALAAEMRRRVETTESVVIKQYRLIEGEGEPRIELLHVHVFPLLTSGAYVAQERRRFDLFVRTHEKGLFRRATGDEGDGWIACHPDAPKLMHHKSLAEFLNVVTPKRA